ncbi:MAG: response regulator transcription factor [Pseudomonadota bacterium]|mgnify:CR=1 FL=1
MKTVLVWIVEDDPQVRMYLAEQVQAHPLLSLVAMHETKQEAVAWLSAQSVAVDALLCDLGLPDGSGQEVISAAVQKWPHCDAMVISMFGDDMSVLSSIDAGAVGYIHKDAPWGDVAQSILDMKAGAAPMSPMIARGVLARLRRLAGPAHASPMDAVKTHAFELMSMGFKLSHKEGEILELISRGFSYAEIAGLQKISIYTVQSHIKNLYRKMAVHSRSEAVFEAQKLGLLRV